MGNQAYQLPLLRVGQDVQIWDAAKVTGCETISIGDSVIIDDFVFIMGGESTTIGSFVHIPQFSSLVGGGRLVLEDFSGLSGGCRIYTGTDDYLGGSLTGSAVPAAYRCPLRSFVHIGKHALLGANTVVLPGIRIGEGAVTGAGSVVTKDLEPWSVNVGVPAKAIKSRPSKRIYELEAKLRSELYDIAGNYVSRERRPR